jgi:hypothetical protein
MMTARCRPLPRVQERWKASAGVLLISPSLDIGNAIDDLLPAWVASDASEWENRLV